MDRIARRLSAVAFALLLMAGLGGCEDQSLRDQLTQARETLATTQQDLQQCQANIKDDFAGRQLAIDTLARNAAIAQACQWGVDICPASWEHVPSPTVQFEVHGKAYPVAPNGWIVFGLVAAKLAAMAAFLIVLLLGMLRLIGPSAKALKEAERTIEEADARADRAEIRAAHAQRRLEQIEADIAHREAAEQARLAVIDASIQSAERRFQKLQQSIADARAELGAKKAASAALGAFQRKPKPGIDDDNEPEPDQEPKPDPLF
jgi:DNA repair exonuclease SbcCD ATPase subunit